MKPETIESLFAAVNAAALLLDQDGRFTLIGKAPEWLVRFCPDLAAPGKQIEPKNVFSFLENFLHEAQSIWRQDVAGCRKSGIWIEADEHGNDHLLEASAVNTGQNNFLIIAHDHFAFSEKQNLIQKGRQLALDRTALQRMQQELEKARDELEARVAARTLELEETNRRLGLELEERKRLEIERQEMILHLQQAQKMEAIGTLAGGIAHDFNNILSAVLGFTELSLSDTPRDTTLHNNLRQVLKAAHRARDLIRQILTFSRQSKPEIKPIQLNTIVYEALRLLRASMPAIIDIRQRIESDAYVLADPTQLHQVIMNLCTNAAQAMESNGGILDIKLSEYELTEADLVVFPDLNPGHFLDLLVKDTGKGMSSEVMSRIFDPFFTTKEKGRGTGMGLSVVHGIVKSCHGTILVSSKLGEGSVFRVLLPALREADALVRPQEPELARGSERILFVDDEQLQVELATQMLGRLGYQVTAMTDCVEALNRFAQTPKDFDLVITDMNMPKMTGKSMAMEMVRIKPGIPIILCSGYNEFAEIPDTGWKTIKACLMKPVAMGEMAETVRRILDNTT